MLFEGCVTEVSLFLEVSALKVCNICEDGILEVCFSVKDGALKNCGPELCVSRINFSNMSIGKVDSLC
jgi:hypothetical protein